ncbi:MAG: zinc-ribbon domain-containing protein [Gemmataceae bacterium]|nr:zinc-ribbon domain-containing protein [Gemmataceae bacterium]
MATPLVVACPECQKQIKATDELKGKKVRCKGCGHIFVLEPPAAHKPAKPAPAKAAAKDDDEDANPYGLKDAEEVVPRCPHCAKELDAADAVICVNCGYNTVTRQRVATRKVVETTGGDQMMWLMPGMVCVGVILVLIILDLIYVFLVPGWVKGGDYEFIGYGGFRLWFVIGSVFFMFFAGKFAVQRLILHPVPPERVVGGDGD